MKMTITINKYNGADKDNNLRGFANVVMDDFALENVKIKESKSGELYAELPRYKRNKGNGEAEYKDVFHPIKQETRQALNEAVLSSYEKTEENGQKFAYNYGKEPMAVKQVKVSLYEKEKEHLKGFANVVFNNGFALENVRIKLSDKSGELYPDLAKYSFKDRDDNGEVKLDENGNEAKVYKDIFHPITKESYNNFRRAVIAAYQTTYENRDKLEEVALEDDVSKELSPSEVDSVGALSDYDEVFADDNLDLVQQPGSGRK